MWNCYGFGVFTKHELECPEAPLEQFLFIALFLASRTTASNIAETGNSNMMGPETVLTTPLFIQHEEKLKSSLCKSSTDCKKNYISESQI